MPMVQDVPDCPWRADDSKLEEDGERFLKFQERGPNFKPVIILKTVPESFTLEQMKSIFTTAPSGSGREPWLKSFDEIQWLRHKSGGYRKMLLAEVSPPDSDPCLARLPSRITLPNLGEIIIGCTRHSCETCKRKGHKASVHDQFSVKKVDPKKADLNVEELVLKTPAVKALLRDPLLKLEDHPTKKEGWKCESCKKSGFGYFTALSHITKTTSHQTQLQLLKRKSKSLNT